VNFVRYAAEHMERKPPLLGPGVALEKLDDSTLKSDIAADKKRAEELELPGVIRMMRARNLSEQEAWKDIRQRFEIPYSEFLRCWREQGPTA
jgi:hypothetical protein